MDWIQFALFMSAIASFWIMARNDSKNMMSIIIAIKDEIKDFHGRLCSLETKVNKKDK